MLKTVIFLEKFRCFNSMEILHFNEGLNILVGDNGSGKSTLLGLIRALTASKEIEEKFWFGLRISKDQAKKIIILDVDVTTSFFGLDFEMDANRGKNHFDFTELQVYGTFSSHGQSSNTWFDQFVWKPAEKLAAEGRKITFLLDEPDASLSPRSMYALLRKLRKMVELGHQIILSAHNPILISNALPGEEDRNQKVYDLESRTYLLANEFLLKQAEIKEK